MLLPAGTSIVTACDLQETACGAAEDGARTNDVTQRGASQQPGEAEGFDHLILQSERGANILLRSATMQGIEDTHMRCATSEGLALNRHGADDQDVGEHHDEGLKHTMYTVNKQCKMQHSTDITPVCLLRVCNASVELTLAGE